MEFWDNILILFALGDNIFMNVIKEFMEKIWSFVSLPELYYNDVGYFIMRFKNQEEKE